MQFSLAHVRSAGWQPLAIRLSILALAALAATATVSGMIALFNGGWQGSIYGGGLGVVIQFLIVVSLRIVTGKSGLRSRGLFAALYAVLVAISVLLGYGFWFDLTAGAGLARETYRAATGDLLTPVTAFRQAYDQLARTAAELAQYSKRRAEEERQTGGTCGSDKRSGSGPRQRLRERDAATFTVFAQHFANRTGDFSHLIEVVLDQSADPTIASHSAAVRMLDRAHEEARALAGDLRLNAFREAVQERLTASAAGFTDPDTGERFICPDLGLEATLRALIAAKLPALPEAGAQLFEATHAASVQRGLKLVTGTANFDRERDALPLAMGLVIDVLLLVLTLAHRALEVLPGTFADLAVRLDPSQLLPPGHAEAWLKVVRADEGGGLAAVLDDWRIDDGRWSYLAAPVAADGPGLAEARRLAAVLRALGLARPLCLRRPDQMPRWWREPRARALSGVEQLRLYRLRHPLADILVREQIRRALDDGAETVAAPDAAAGGAIVPLPTPGRRHRHPPYAIARRRPD